jgi:UDP-galactopyranose mutase
LYTEYSRLAAEGDIPYYPIRQVKEKEQLHQYVQAGQTASRVTFLGRLGTYRYLDMDVTIKEALDVAEEFLASRREQRQMTPFVVNPL